MLGLLPRSRPLDVVASRRLQATPGVSGSQRLFDGYHALSVLARSRIPISARPGGARAARPRRHDTRGYFIGYLFAFSDTGHDTERDRADAVQAPASTRA